MTRLHPVGLLGTAGLAMACSGYSGTTRLVDGELLAGQPIAPQAYALYLDATLKEANGDLQGARETYLTALEFEGGNADIWTCIGRVNCRLDPETGDDEFVKALQADRTHAPAWLERSRCELRRGNLDVALEFAKSAQLFAPDSAETTGLIAEVYVRRRDAESALRQWVGYVVLHPENPEGWIELAGLAERQRVSHWKVRPSIGAEETTLWGPISPVHPEPQQLVVDAILLNDLTSARAHATAHRLPQLVVLETALTHGRTQLAVEQAKLLLATFPESGDVRTYALIAAVRANDEGLLEACLKVPPRLTLPSADARRHLTRLVEELTATTVVSP